MTHSHKNIYYNLQPKYRNPKPVRCACTPYPSNYDELIPISKPIGGVSVFNDYSANKNPQEHSKINLYAPNRPPKSSLLNIDNDIIAESLNPEKSASLCISRKSYHKDNKFLIQEQAFIHYHDNAGRRSSQGEFSRRRGSGGQDRYRSRLKSKTTAATRLFSKS